MSPFHKKNDRIRKALARRAREKGLEIDDAEVRSLKYDLAPDEPGDGRIVRKEIDEEGDDQWDR